MSEQRRRGLERAIKALSWLAAGGLLYVLADFAVDFRPRHIQESYRFRLPALVEDQPQILQRDQLRVLVLKRSRQLQQQLLQSDDDLQDPGSKRSSQPDNAANLLRSKAPELFVSLALGTDLQCLLIIDEYELKESCSDARYDFAGRAKKSNRRYDNLTVPDYRYSDDGKYLIVSP